MRAAGSPGAPGGAEAPGAPSGARGDGWLHAAWVAGVAAYFAPAWATGRVLAFGDALNQDLPLRVLAAQGLLAGELPFWNPWVFAGQPLLAAIQVGVFFPGNVFFLALPPAEAMNAAVVAAVAWAGAGMIAFARALGLARPAAVAGALVFALGGFMALHLETLQVAHGAALAPWLLWAVARLATPADRRYAAAGAALLALQVLAGHPQTVVFSGLLVGAYTLFRAWGRGAVLALAALVPVAGLGLAALQLLPTLDFIPLTQRAAIGWDQLVARSLPPRQLATLWMPFLLGGVPSPLVPTPYWGAPHLTELVGYGGLGALVLAGLALARGARRAEALFFAGAAGVALLLALGWHTPLYALVAHLPVLGALPAPGRHLLAFDLALATLAALGTQRLLAGPAAVTGRATAAAWALGAAPALLGALALAAFGGMLAARIQPWLPAGIDLAAGWRLGQPAVWLPAALALALGALLLAWRRGRAVGPLLVALLACDLVLFGWHAGWRQRAPEAAALPWPEPLGLQGAARALALYPDPVYPYDQVPVMRALRLPNWGALGEVRHVGGYDAFVYARYAGLLGDLHSGGAAHDVAAIFAPGHHMLDLLATRAVLLDARLAADPLWRARLAPPRWREVGREPGVVAFENARALPRAWRVDRVVALAPAEVDRRVRGEAPFDPQAEVLIEGASSLLPGGERGGVRLVREAGNQIELDLTGPAGPVVLSTNFDPGWRATAAGRDVPLLRADGALIAFHAPPGPARVTLRYAPRRWPLGLGVSLATLLALAAWLLAGKRGEAPPRGAT